MKPVAVLSTTVLPLDGVYHVATLKNLKDIDIKGVSHYIGHPATREIVESLGATQADSNLFTGLKVGEAAICFAIKQGMSNRAIEGKTVDQDVTLDMLSVRIIQRLDEWAIFNNMA